MELYLILSILQLAACPIFVFSTQVSPIFFPNEPAPSIRPTCSNMNRPCDVLVRSGGQGSTEYRSAQSICQCPGPNACPADWDTDPARTVTQQLKTRSQLMNLQMKFCEPVASQKRCRRRNEVALTMRGNSVLPSEVYSVSCRCRRNPPLQLARTWTDGWRSYQEFTCSLRTCDVNLTAPPVCMNVTSSMTHLGPKYDQVYPCNCPSDYHCSFDSSGMQMRGESTYGYCQRTQK